MIAIIKTLVKVLLTYFYNGFQIIRFSKFGFGSTIAAGLQVHGPTGINIAQKVRIGRFARLSCYSTKYQNGSIYIDKGCYIGDFFSVLTADTVMIRENVLIASYVTILGENHGTDPECGIKYGLQDLIGKAVVIEDHCWIGEKAIIMPGVTIGSHCVIGAGSIVTSDIPSYSIVVGNPAKIIKRYNFDTHCWEKL